MRKIIILCGVPSSGKTTLINQVRDLFEVVENDDHIGKDYVGALLKASEGVGKPVLAEAPFSISQVVDPLRAKARDVTTVFLIEDDRTLTQRYFKRDRKPIPAGHLTRNRTYAKRAEETGSFMGNGEKMLEHLKGWKK
jgi:nicotinamide riboside kinase